MKNDYTIRYEVETIYGTKTVNTMTDALQYFKGALDSFKQGKDDIDATFAFYSYLLMSGKIKPIKVYPDATI